MYATWLNQLTHMLHFGFAFLLLFVFWPRLLFTANYDTPAAVFFARFTKMVLLLILLGYLLVILKLFEILAIVGILIILTALHTLKIRSTQDFSGRVTRFNVWLFDWFDGHYSFRAALRYWFVKRKEQLQNTIRQQFRPLVLCNYLLSIYVFGHAAYLRFADAWHHAALPMSDSYVTLAWMKYIARRILFHDGIYPQGFHIYLATLHKFAAIDQIYVLKYAGPLNGVLITLGIYLLVARVTGRPLAGLLAAWLYGVMGSFLPLEWQRQAATNSQEFAFVFIMPAFYFVLTALKEHKRDAFITAGAAVMVAGLVHAIAFVFICGGIILLCLIAVLLRISNLRVIILRFGMIIGIAGVAAALPLGIGLLMGRHLHGSSAEYLVTQSTHIIAPVLGMLDYLALGGLALWLLVSLLRRQSVYEMLKAIFIFLMGTGTFVVYRWGGVYTQNEVIASRMPELWTLMLVIGMGCLAAGLATVLLRLPQGKWMELSAAVIVIAWFTVNLSPQPITPYKMEYDSCVEQYLRISGQFLPTEWMIVSQNEGYALALGNGYHMMLGDFLTNYSPKRKQLVSSQGVLRTPDIFIFREKQTFRTSFANLQSEYDQRERDYRKLIDWVKHYRANHHNLSVYYEDAKLVVYRIHQPLTQDAKFDQVWNG